MKAKVILLTLALGVSTCLLTAQDGPAPRDGQRPPGRDGGPGGPGMPGGPRRVDPITEALDLNKDGVIDAEEIARATESLKKLDQNGDAKLTIDEIRPPRPGGRGGPGAPGMAREDEDQAGPHGAGADVEKQQLRHRQEGPTAGPDNANDRRPLNPIVAALDLNRNGIIDADEMIKASESLQKLDKNNDGRLTADEFRPARLAGRNGPEEQVAPGEAREGRGHGAPDMAREDREQAGPRGAASDFERQETRHRENRPAAGPAGMNARGFVPPIFAALDLNKDGVIDADEMAKAGESLKALDKNNDGKLTLGELRPQDSGGRGGPGMNDGNRPERPTLED